MVQFREHRGALADSLATARPIKDRAALIEDVRAALAPFGLLATDAAVTVRPYCFDERTGWDTHIVSLDGYGVLGFTDGPL